MRALTSLARSVVPGVVLACVMSLGAPCDAQEPDPPTAPPAAEGRGSLVAPSAWLVVNTPLQKQIGLKVYGFYIGALEAPVAQVDVPIRATRFLTITPSYMYYSVPASGLDRLPSQPVHFAERYEEQQFRIDGTFAFVVRKLEISARNMYVRRFRPGPLDDLNRYRGRLAVAYPLAVHGRVLKPFLSYEAFDDRHAGWNRSRVWSGVTLPVTKRLLVQPSYMWEKTDGSRDVNYLLFGLIVNTRSSHKS
jgi:Protein of unknown function (DUF2490)